MKVIWAPWRINYILGPKETGCLFCEKLQAKNSREALILYQGKKSFVMMNLYPYNNGHLMIAPYRHLSSLDLLEKNDLLDLMQLVQESAKIIKQLFKPDGLNIGINEGKVAGAGVADHLHLHTVPRWSGDTNFMPVLSDTRVISEHLFSTYDKLLPYFEKL